MMVGNGHNADGGRLNKNFHGLDVCNVINTAAAKISVLKMMNFLRWIVFASLT